jgi:hypothetical protein
VPICLPGPAMDRLVEEMSNCTLQPKWSPLHSLTYSQLRGQRSEKYAAVAGWLTTERKLYLVAYSQVACGWIAVVCYCMVVPRVLIVLLRVLNKINESFIS